MPSRTPVAFAGFSAFERSALASAFRLSAGRQPAYLQVATTAEGRFIVADADLPHVVEEVVALGRCGDTVFVGAHAPAGAGGWMMRPIDPSHVLHELDVLLSRQGAAGSAVAGPYSLPVGGARGPLRLTAGEGPGRRATDSEFGSDEISPLQRQRARTETREALLVDDSEIALRLLELKLQRTGLRTRCASNSQQTALALAQRPADFIFLDVDLGPESELDGVALCQEIRRMPANPSRATPVLVMVSANHSETERARGSHAGCDAFLGKPLDDDPLRRVLTQHGVRFGQPVRYGQPAALDLSLGPL
jgi:two-component system cell cycle response regulator